MKLLKYFMLISITGLIIIYTQYFELDESFWKTIITNVLVSLLFIFISTFVIEKFMNKDNDEFNEKEFFEIASTNIALVLFEVGSLIDGVYNGNANFPIPDMDSLRKMAKEAEDLNNQRRSNYDEEYIYQMYLDIYDTSSKGKDEKKLLITEEQYLNKLKDVNNIIDNYVKTFASIAPKKHIKEVLLLKGNLAVLYAFLPKETDERVFGLNGERMIFVGKIASMVLKLEKEKDNNTNSKLFDDSFFWID